MKYFMHSYNDSRFQSTASTSYKFSAYKKSSSTDKGRLPVKVPKDNPDCQN
jgi:hypothetical protein